VFPQPCFGCDDYFHAVKAQYFGSALGIDRDAIPENRIEAQCGGCLRTVYFEIGAIEDPEAWAGKFFYLSRSDSDFEKVPMDVFVAAQREFLAANGTSARSIHVIRAGVPFDGGFIGMLADGSYIHGKMSDIDKPLDSKGLEIDQPQTVSAWTRF
jgi:hypothetical protein